MLPQQKKTKYLNNRDLLTELHNSKCSFCSFTRPEHHQYDLIVNTFDDINPESLLRARKNRAKSIGLERLYTARDTGNKDVKLADLTPDYTEIPETTVVFRLSTFNHIPLSPGRKKTVKVTADSHERVNFPPFQHWKYDENGHLQCVGKSHWKGPLDTGSFSRDHGRISESLGRMFIMLSERYAQRSNWRGYCVDEKTEALTGRGWAKMQDITEADTIVSYNGETLCWSSVRSVYRGEYSGKMFHLTRRGLDCLVTPKHRFVTERGLKPIELLTDSDVLVLMGDGIEDPYSIMSDTDVIAFADQVITDIENESDISFIQECSSMSSEQRQMFIDHIDETIPEDATYSQTLIDSLQGLYVMLGKRPGLESRIAIDEINMHGAFNAGSSLTKGTGKVTHPNEPTVEYNGMVWCPETEYGSFVARRNGSVFLTGNTYVDEMRGQALLQLSQVGLQFDESKSSNPFAYFTTVVTNSFTKVLNVERTMQNTRDNILEYNGLQPSMSRQNSGHFAEETAKQAEFYKNIVIPRAEPDEEIQ